MFTPALVKHTRVRSNWVNGVVLVKMYRNIAKSHIFESVSFFYSSIFSGYKDVRRAGTGRRVYQPKERLASNLEIGKS